MVRYSGVSVLIICLHYLVGLSFSNDVSLDEIENRLDIIENPQKEDTIDSKENDRTENISTTLDPSVVIKINDSKFDELLDLGKTEETEVVYDYDKPPEYEGTEDNEPPMNLGTEETYDYEDRSVEPDLPITEESEPGTDIGHDSENYGSGDRLDSRRAISNDSEYIPWDELHIVKIRTVTTSGIRKSGGALVQDKIVVSSCRCIKPSDENNPITFPENEYKNENDIIVRRSVTGETRFVDKITFGIRWYCIDDPDTSVLVVLILTKPFHTEPLQLVPRAAGHKLCHFYAFKRYPDYAPEPSILGHYDLSVHIIHANGQLCRNATYDLNNPRIVCGVIMNDDHQFCNLRVGGVVICSLRLLGVTQTSCRVPYYQHAMNKTRIIAYVSMLTRRELRYWQKLIALFGGETDSSIKNGYHFSLIVSLIAALEFVNISYKT